MLYEVGSWTMYRATEKKTDAYEMRIFCKYGQARRQQTCSNLKHSHVQIIDNGINAVQEQPQRNCSEEKKNKPLKNRLELCLLDCMKAF